MDEMELLEADCKTEPENEITEIALLEEQDVTVKTENTESFLENEENEEENISQILEEKVSETLTSKISQEPPSKRLKGSASK